MQTAASLAGFAGFIAVLGCGDNFTLASSSDDSGPDDRSATVMGTGGQAGSSSDDTASTSASSATGGPGGMSGTAGANATGGSGGMTGEDGSRGGTAGTMDAAGLDQITMPEARADAKDAAVERRTGGLLLPFAVDSVYVPTGYEGDGALSRVTATDASGSTTCNRAPGATFGMCHVFTYKYQHTADTPGWAGVVWQSPANNWGTQPGPVIAEGAKRVAFSARSAFTIMVRFVVGGIAVTNNPYQDTIRQEIRVIVAPAWQEFSIDLTGSAYVNVLGGFDWTLVVLDNGIDPNANASADYVLYLDNIRWE
jgi:hypothetical protein